MALFLLITYIVILIFQIILFVISIRKKTKKLWRILFSAELVPLLISIGLMIYYNNLPGYGFMPGLTYLGEVLFSFGAVVLYCISFLISICSYIAISNNAFRNCVVTAGAKTGTSQLGEDKTNNAIFMCYAPFDDPEIAIAIVVERGQSGANLSKMARNVLDAYFSLGTLNTTAEREYSLLK